jgi:outer membrane protein TolC
MIMKPIIVLSAIALVTGCATVRHAREAQDEKNVPAGERTVVAAEAGLTAGTVLTLPRALNVALRFHPSVVEARQALVIANAQLAEAKAGRQPNFGANAGYRRATSNAQGKPTGGTSHNSYNAGLTADILLFDFGKTPALIREALARQLAAEDDLRAAQNDVIFNVRSAFYTLSENTELLKVAEETVRQFEVHLRQVQSLFEVGKRIKYDITKAQVDLGNAKLTLINSSNAVTTARAVLNRAMGLAEEPGCVLGDVPHEDFSATTASLIQSAREHQPELHALQMQVRAASAAVDAAIADLYPALRLNGTFGWSGDHFPLVWNWSAAADAAMNIFDGGTRYGRITETAAQLRAARARQAAREQQMFADLSLSMAALDAAQQRMKLAELIVQQARESLDLVGERYRLGLATAVEEADAQAALANSRAEQVKARFDMLNNVASIKHTVGEP